MPIEESNFRLFKPTAGYVTVGQSDVDPFDDPSVIASAKIASFETREKMGDPFSPLLPGEVTSAAPAAQPGFFQNTYVRVGLVTVGAFALWRLLKK